jgi:hypothetical protein
MQRWISLRLEKLAQVHAVLKAWDRACPCDYCRGSTEGEDAGLPDELWEYSP